MTNEEAKKYIKSKMCNDCGVYLGGGKCSDNCKVIEAINTLEQEPKSEWQQDHEILKAYSDGANDMLDKIEAVIEEMPKTYPFVNHIDAYVKVDDIKKILDEYSTKYTTEKYVAGSTVVNIIDRTACTYTEPTDCYSAIAITCNKGPEN